LAHTVDRIVAYLTTKLPYSHICIALPYLTIVLHN